MRGDDNHAQAFSSIFITFSSGGGKKPDIIEGFLMQDEPPPMSALKTDQKKQRVPDNYGLRYPAICSFTTSFPPCGEIVQTCRVSDIETAMTNALQFCPTEEVCDDRVESK